MKLFCFVKTGNDLNTVDAADEDVKINGLTGTADSLP